MKKNCWEYTECGREPGGSRVHTLGVCPVPIEDRLEGVNSGSSAGRACWALTGTLCGGDVQGTYANKFGDCRQCDFYQQVKQEEGNNYTGTRELLVILKNS